MPEIRRRSAIRDAMRLCLHHDIECTCQGCVDIYDRLRAGPEPGAGAVSELKPCPFCGQRAVVVDLGLKDGDPNAGGVTVECTGCRASALVAFGEDARDTVLSTWNRRAEPTQDRDREAMEGYAAHIWGKDWSNHIHLPGPARLKPGTAVTVLVPADAILGREEG